MICNLFDNNPQHSFHNNNSENFTNKFTDSRFLDDLETKLLSSGVDVLKNCRSTY